MARYGIDEALRAKILSIPGVSELLGDRLYADDIAPQNAEKIYGVLTLIGDAGRYRKIGSANKTVKTRYQVDFWGLLKSAVRGLAELVTATKADGGLDGFDGTIGSGTSAAHVQDCRIENTRHGSDRDAEAGEALIYNAGFDVVIVFNE